MLLQKTNPKNIQFLLLAGCFSVIIGLLFSKAILSLSTAYLILLFIVRGNYSEGYTRLKKNKAFLFFILFIAFYVVSLSWSSLIYNGLSDLLSKCNLILLPIVLIALPTLSSKNKASILRLFAAFVIIESSINFTIFELNFSPDKDIRTMSLFVSHIRFSLFVVFAIFILAYQKQAKIGLKIIHWLGIAWLLFYTYYAQVLSGVLALCISTIILLIVGFKNSNKWVKICSLITIVSIISALTISVLIFNKNNVENINLKSYPKYTKLGHLYTHDTISKAKENGFPLNCFINEQELDSTWKTKSAIALSSLTKNNFNYHTVLIRYLTSKGLTKDAEGINKLSNQDIKNIELGIPTILNLQTGLQNRLNELHYQLSNFENPNGHSILQRLEYWKTGWSIFKKNWFIGTGIGDYKEAYQKEYTNLNSLLQQKNRLESHNQFLGIAIATGSVGLLLFLLHLTYTFRIFWQKKEVIPVLFLSICISSFLVEDTLTTLAGMSFFSFFIGLFLTNNSIKNEINK